MEQRQAEKDVDAGKAQRVTKATFHDRPSNCNFNKNITRSAKSRAYSMLCKPSISNSRPRHSTNNTKQGCQRQKGQGAARRGETGSRREGYERP